MIKTLITNLFLVNMNGSKGFVFFDEDTIAWFVVICILVHLICIAAYYTQSEWLKLLSTLLYLPLIVIFVGVSIFVSGFIVVLLFSILFFIVTVARKRKEKY